MHIASTVGAGTTVTLFLPRDLAECEPIIGKESTSAEFGTEKETILVVEDDEDVRGYTVSVLRELGYRVIEAVDGKWLPVVRTA